MDATIQTNEGLFASEYYWNYTQNDTRIAEIQTILMREEDRQKREKMRLERELHRATFAANMGEKDEYPFVTSLNSSILTEGGPKGMKNVYKYEEVRQKELATKDKKDRHQENRRALGKIGVRKNKNEELRR